MTRLAERVRCESGPISLKHEHWRGENKWCRDRFISTAKDFDVSYSSVLDNVVKEFGSVSIDSEILGGTPRISGTPLRVHDP